MNMLFRGIRFGMLLQIAIGPMCVLVFNTASTQGLVSALVLTCAIALIDALYITLAGIGISRFLESAKAKKVMKILGGSVLVLFGLNMALGILDMSFLPSLSLAHVMPGYGIFLTGLLLTASNPLTIVFWGGVFTTQISPENIQRRQLALFGAGCVLATLLFMSMVSLLGLVVNHFLTDTMIRVLNSIVGLMIIFFGIRLLVKKD